MFALFLLAHLVADFVLQPFWLVQRKRRWDGLLIHGGVVLGCMALLTVFDHAVWHLWPVILGITAVHVAADRWKVRYGDKLFRTPIVPFLLDQAIHITTLVVALSLALPADRIWSLSGSPVAAAALYAIGYVVAAAATPIGVMVWLDPSFKDAALAGQARFRSLYTAAAVVSLVVANAFVAAPLSLVVFATATRTPASTHPLDSTTGMLTVICVAALIGAGLALLR